MLQSQLEADHLPIAWYFIKDGLEHGPVGSDDLRMLASLGMLHPADLVRKSEMRRWAPASGLKGLFREGSMHPPRAGGSGTSGGHSSIKETHASSHRRPAHSAGWSNWVWYLTATAALFAAAGGIFHFCIRPRDSQAIATHAQASSLLPTTEPVLANATIDINDPLLTAISSESVFDRGMALRQVRCAMVSAKLRPQVHQLICDTLVDPAFSPIWPSAARALGEVGTASDLIKLKPLIEKAPLETQCAATATAMVLDPENGLRLFERKVANETYASTTTGYLAGWGARSEPVAMMMLKSPQRVCRYHALFLLKAFGTPKALDALSTAKQLEPDKLITDGYQFTMDAINSRNQ